MRSFLFKDKRRMRERIGEKVGHSRANHHTKVDVKARRKFLQRNPVADMALGEDGISYVPFRYIRGTIHLPGTEPGSSYVRQE